VDGRRPDFGAGAEERVAVLAIAARDAAPRVLRDVDAHADEPRTSIEEMARERQRERLRLVHRFPRRKRVDGVLHRVRRQHVGVVAVHIGGVVVSLEADGHGEIAHVVAPRAPGHLHEAHARLAVRGLSEHGA
jgi:hypothetical protein